MMAQQSTFQALKNHKDVKNEVHSVQSQVENMCCNQRSVSLEISICHDNSQGSALQPIGPPINKNRNYQHEKRRPLLHVHAVLSTFLTYRNQAHFNEIPDVKTQSG